MKVDNKQQVEPPRSMVACESLVCSSRIRLARNLAGIAFPGWSGPSERAAVWERVVQVLRAAAHIEHPLIQTMGELEPLQRTMLQERRLISAELAAGDATSGVIYEESGRLSVMVNEEDHLRIQSVASGFSLQSAWLAAQALHADMEHALSFAFSPRWGYLTACPSNVGTGIRASVMVHLAGLRLMGELEPVVRGLERTGFAVRGVSGEGSSAYGGFCQISNQKTLGVDEPDTLRDVEDMVASVLRTERDARSRLIEIRPWVLEDAVARAYGLLRHARLLTTAESLDSLSMVMLGIDCRLIGGIDIPAIQVLMQEMQPGHLQFHQGRMLAVVDRDQFRARHVQQAVAAMELI